MSFRFIKSANRSATCRLQRVSTAIALAMTLGVAACSDDELVLKGDRVAVLPERAVIVADASAFDEGAGLAPLVTMPATAVGLNAGHAGGHPQFEGRFKRLWSASIGGKGSDLVDLAVPVAADGRVFAVAPNGLVTAIGMGDGDRLWQSSVEAIDDDPLPGVAGGLAITPDGVVAHAGGRNLALLDTASGAIEWSVTAALPLRGGPTLIEDIAVAVTDIDGNLLVYKLDNGEAGWDRVGMTGGTVMFGAPAPAYANGALVVAGARGEVTYFDAENGELIWTDSVAALNPRTPIEGIGDIRAHPVHDGGMIFVISQSGRMAAFNARTGLVVWEQPIGGIEMPWLAGETLYVMGLDGRLYALRRSDGAVRWVAELPGAVPPDVVVSEKPPRYVGPVVAGGRVMVLSKAGRVHVFNPDTGVETENHSLGSTILTAPQLVAGKLLVLGQNGSLSAFE